MISSQPERRHITIGKSFFWRLWRVELNTAKEVSADAVEVWSQCKSLLIKGPDTAPAPSRRRFFIALMTGEAVTDLSVWLLPL
jgi:hypothetical protein